MELNLHCLNGYIADEKAARDMLATAKSKIDFARLQAKQVREMIKLAKTHATLRAFVKAMPADQVEVMPSPGLIYASVTLHCMQASLYRDVPETLGLILMEQRTVDNSLGSPILRQYRSEDRRVQFFITTNVR